MASYNIRYIFDFVTQNLGALTNVGKAAQGVQGAMSSAAGAAQSLGSAIGTIAGKAAEAAGGLNSAARAAREYSNAARQAAASSGSLQKVAQEAAEKNYGMIMAAKAGKSGMPAQFQTPEEAKAWGKAAAQRAAASDSGGMFAGVGGKLMNAYMGYHLAKMGLHGADATIARAADVDEMRQKLAFVLGGTPESAMQADEAVRVAKDMNKKFKNVGVSEAMHIIDDLRANLPESFDEVLHGAVDPFVKLQSFLKTWRGGKHGGNAEAALKDVGTAIRSGELMGNMTHDQIAKHVQSLAIAQAIFGEKFKISEYFAAQKAASQALPGMSDNFKYLGFPVLVQELGTRAGVGLATMFNKLVGGIMIRGPMAEAWRSLGLVNMDQVGLTKGGTIDPKSLAGKNWLKGGELLKSDPFEFMVQQLLPALGAKGNIKGLDAAGIQEAWQTGNIGKLAQLISAINKADLSQALSPLGYDRTAVTEMFSMITRLASLARDYKSSQAATKAYENADPTKALDTWNRAKQEFGAQFDGLVNSIFGKDSVGVMVSGLNAISGAMGNLAAAISAAKVALGLGSPSEQANAAWEKKMQGVISNLGFAPLSAAEQIGADYRAKREAARMGADAGWYDRQWTQIEGFGFGNKVQEPGLLERFMNGLREIVPFMPSKANAAEAGGSLGASSLPQSIAVTSTFTANFNPAQVNVNVTGQVNGPVQGNGSGTLQAEPVRGTSMPSVGGGSPAQ